MSPKMITADMLASAKRSSSNAIELEEYEAFDSLESDEEITERIAKKFKTLASLTRACKQGKIKSLIVSGASGMGKSFEVEQVLSKHDMFNTIANERKYEIIKGEMTSVNLYKKLWEHRSPRSTIVFDDCDEVLLERKSLNILKAALDTTKVRTVGWYSESRALRDDDIPNSFAYEGTCIFISNINFDLVKSKQLKIHLDSMVSRAHYLDMTIASRRERLLSIKQKIDNGMIKHLEEAQQQEIYEYLVENASDIRKLDLRSVVKIAELVDIFPDDWRDHADETCSRLKK